MKPGRELDALIAEKVMGIKHPITIHRDKTAYQWGSATDEWEFLPEYSTDIAAAWKVVEKLGLCVWPTEDAKWFAFQDRFDSSYGEEYWFGGENFLSRYVIADTAPHAICLAALKALEAKTQD
jgi:hypothetical protein